MSLGFGNLKSQDIEVGFFGGVSYYVGDINPGMPFVQSKPAYGALVRYNMNTRMALKLNYYRGKIAGDDAISNAVEDRGLAFESSINDFSAIFEFHFLPYFTGSRKSYFTPYLFGGASLFTYNPKHGDVILRDMGTEGQNEGFNDRKPYSKVSFAVPFGIGIKYGITKKLGFAFEWGLRKTFTDYIDDVSTVYADPSTLSSENTPVSALLADRSIKDPNETVSNTGLQRGNSKTKDWYSFAGIILTFKINNKTKVCSAYNQHKVNYNKK